MLTIRCIAACDIAETVDRSRIMHLKPGLVAEMRPTHDLALALRAGSVRVEGRPPPADVAALDAILAALEVDAGKARMDAAIAAQVRADAAALASASDADIAATVASQATASPPPSPSGPRVTRAPRAARRAT